MSVIMRVSRLFTRYLASFVFVFIIPFAALGFFIDRYLFSELLQKARETQYQETVRNATILDHRLAELNQLWVQISSDSDFQPFLFHQNPFRAYLLIKELRKYTYPNNFVDALYVLYRNDSYVYSAGNGQTLEFFLDSLEPGPADRGAAEAKRQQIKEILYQSTEKTVWSERGSVYVSIPFPDDVRNPTGTLVFKISQATLADYMKSDRLEAFQIGSADGQLLVTWGTEIMDNPVEYRSSRSGWRYRSVVRESAITEEIRPIRLMFGYAMVGILVVGLLFVTVASVMNYSPIRNLRRFFERDGKATTPDVGELDFIKGRFAEILAEEESLREQMRHELPMLREAVIARLVNGSVEELATLEDVGLEFHEQCFLVAVADFGGDLPVYARPPLEVPSPDQVRGRDSVASFCTAGLSMGRLIIVASSEEGSAYRLHRMLEDLHRGWTRAGMAQVTMSCSSIKSGLDAAGEAYMEAVEALTHRIAKRANALIRYDDLRTSPLAGWPYPYEAVRALHRSVAAGKAGDVSLHLERILAQMESEEIDVRNVRRLYFNIMNSIAAGFRERSGSHRDELPFPDVFLLERIGSRDEMSALLRETALRVRQTLDSGGSGSPRYIDELKSFLNEQYQDASLSLQSLADRFRLTPAHLSTSFKKHVGTNISEYISDLRLQKAVDLLCCSEMPIKAIVGLSGYTDSSSFIRKFKSAYGVTPGEYRRRHAAEGATTGAQEDSP